LQHLAVPIALIIGVALVIYALRRQFENVRVWEYEKGLLYERGRFARLLDPGQYWVFKFRRHITRVDMRPQHVAITGQEVLSADSITLKVSVAIRYQVADPYIAVNKVQDYSQSLHLLVQLALREIIGSKPIDELLENRQSFDTTLMEQCTKEIAELGLTLLSVNIRDIMFPGELKNVFAQVVKARKEGLAALERARAETAALRNLANAAKVMENNPALMQLRIIQSLGGSSGNTIVMGLPQDSVLSVTPKKGSPKHETTE
jgi:regulator of protease activity HflC (stomatin/prohibitin superfamily)